MLTLAFARGKAPTPQTDRKGNEWRDDRGDVIARTFLWAGLYWIVWPSLGVFVFSADSREVRVWAEPHAQRRTVVDAFRRMIKPVVLQALGWQVLHAGATIGPSGVIAFCGGSGAGKSTLAFAMQQAGWQQFADDNLLLRLDGDFVIACPLPFTPRLRPAARAHFANLRGPLPSSLRRRPPDTPLAAIFVLQQNAGLAKPRVSLMPRARAFSQLLPYAHCFDAEDRAHTCRLVKDYLAVASRVRAFWLEYPPNFQCLRQLINSVTEATKATNRSSFTSEAQQLPLVQ
jgi:hypothetical protein